MVEPHWGQWGQLLPLLLTFQNILSVWSHENFATYSFISVYFVHVVLPCIYFFPPLPQLTSDTFIIIFLLCLLFFALVFSHPSFSPLPFSEAVFFPLMHSRHLLLDFLPLFPLIMVSLNKIPGFTPLLWCGLIIYMACTRHYFPVEHVWLSIKVYLQES